MNPIIDRFKAYLSLTQPVIQFLGVGTGAAALVIEGSLLSNPLRLILVLVLLALAGGSAKAFNQIFERDIDARLERTRMKRPLPQGKLTVREAAIFASALGIIAVLLMGVLFNWLAAFILLLTITFYSLIYTFYLKPRTPANIVIGGAAGAMGPVICWAAAAGSLTLTPWLIFAIVFFWTPPHFWSLAIYYHSDYEEIGIPFLPLVIGDERTWLYIFFYTVITVAFTPLLAFAGLGLIYLITAAVLGIIFIIWVRWAQNQATRKAAHSLFLYSIVYLMTLCAAMIVDRLL